MGLFVLQETPVGYALFKAKSSKKLKDGFIAEDDSIEDIVSKLKLKDFHKFDSAATALEQAAALVEGKVTPRLSSLLDTIKDEAKASLAVADPKLASAINKLPQLDLKLVSDSTTTDMYRTIRNNLHSLIPGLSAQDINTMSLGLSHSLSRHKLKFSTDKVDTMIVQAISLLDDLDKELNIYAMRVKEWYGWHFPEMARIVNDNLAYSRMILKMGMRSNTAKTDLSDILPDEIETAVKNAAEVSMGTEITEDDLDNIRALAEQVISFTEYRSQLASYLSARMLAVAPNLTALLGDLVGARLIAHSGSLMNLAKSPASTIQILGAEKALFRALKTKHDTPKYGLIYHSSLIGQASGKNKGKIARVLGARAALGLRIDALADWSQEGEGKGDEVPDEDRAIFGQSSRDKIERRLAQLEGKPVKPKGVAIAPNGVSAKPGKWEVKEAKKYNRDADGLEGDEPAKRPQLIEEITDEPARKKVKRSKLKEPDPIKEPIAVVAEPDSDLSDSDEGDSDEDMADAATEVKQPTTKTVLIQELNGEPEKHDTTTNGDDKSVTLSTVSDDSPDSAPSPTPQERNWQSPIEGNTIVAKKLRKAERHHRKLIIGPERNAENKRQREKLARKLDRQKRREKKEQQRIRRDDRDGEKYAEAAVQAGLSIARYKRKLERGEITFGDDGKARSISKKDIKKARKMEEKSAKKAKDKAPDVTAGSVQNVKEKDSKKRKREVADDDEVEEKARRKAEKKAKKLRKEAKKAAKAAA